MPRPKAFLTETQIALLALVLSILSAISAVYQWWSSGRDEKIRSAIDMSDHYLEQWIDIPITLARINAGQSAGSTDLENVRKQQAKLEYTAFLANRGLINSNYLAQRVTCDIAMWTKDRAPEAERFNNEHPKACTPSSQSK